jgi:hypothetical protein
VLILNADRPSVEVVGVNIQLEVAVVDILNK